MEQATTEEQALIRKAVVLYPMQPLATKQVRHARREWVRAVSYLRTYSGAGWCLDTVVTKSTQTGRF